MTNLLVSNGSKYFQSNTILKRVDWCLLKFIKDSSSIFNKHVIVELQNCGWGMGGQHPLQPYNQYLLYSLESLVKNLQIK